MRIDITVNKKALDEVRRLARYRLFKLKIDLINRRLNYSQYKYIVCEEDVLRKMLKMIENIELDKELIL